MKALVFSRHVREDGRRVLGVLAKDSGLHDIRVVCHPHRTGVYIFSETEDGNSAKRVLAELQQIPLEAQEVQCEDWDAFVAELKRTGIIPQGWPRPIQ